MRPRRASRSRCAQACRMGHPAFGQHQSLVRTIRRFRRSQSGLAARRRCSAAAPRTRCGMMASTHRRCGRSLPRTAPSTAKGRYMLARILLAQGDRDGAANAGAARLAPRRLPAQRSRKRVLEMFGGMLTAADHKVRMEQPLLRRRCRRRPACRRAPRRQRPCDRPGTRRGAAARRGNAKALLDAVPAAAQRDAGYIFARVQWLRQNNKPEEAGKLILTAPKDPEALVNLDQWWLERRLLVRKLLDEHDAHAAYQRCARCGAADERRLPRRRAFHGRLGRAALSAQSESRCAAFRAHRGRHPQSARTLARRLLAGPRRGGDGPECAGQSFL